MHNSAKKLNNPKRVPRSSLRGIYENAQKGMMYLCVFIGMRPHSHIGDISIMESKGSIFLNAGEVRPLRRPFFLPTSQINKTHDIIRLRFSASRLSAAIILP